MWSGFVIDWASVTGKFWRPLLGCAWRPVPSSNGFTFLIFLPLTVPVRDVVYCGAWLTGVCWCPLSAVLAGYALARPVWCWPSTAPGHGPPTLTAAALAVTRR